MPTATYVAPSASPRPTLTPPPKRPGRWRQFSLRSLLAATLISSLLMALVAHQRKLAADQQAAYRLIMAKGGATNFGPESSRPRWLQWILGTDVAADGGCVEFGNSDATDDDVRRLTALRNLTRLSLDVNPITDHSLEYVSRLRRLKYMSLSETAITDAGLERLHACRELEWLSLVDTRVTAAGVQKLRTALPGLSVVDAADNELPPLNPPAKAGS